MSVIGIPLGTSSDDSLLRPLYKLQVDPAGTLGASDGLAFSNDGTKIVVTDNFANAYVHRASDGNFLGVGASHRFISPSGQANSDGEINAVDFSVDDSLFVTGLNDFGTKVWHTQTGALVAHLNNGTETDGAAFSPNGQWLATAADGNVNIYDVNHNFALVTSFFVSDKAVNSIDWSPDSQFIVTGAASGGIRLYRTSDWSFVRDFPIDSSTKSVEFSPDGRYIAIGARAGSDAPPNSEPGIARVFAVETGELVADLVQRGNLVPLPFDDQDKRVATEAVAWSNNGNYLFTSGVIDGVMRVWRAEDWSLVGYAQAQETNRAIEAIDVSIDGKVAVAGDEGSVYVYQFNSPQLDAPFQGDRTAANIISMEVERNDTNLSQGGFAWYSYTDVNASGGEYLTAIATTNTTIDQIDANFQTGNPLVDSPKLDFRVNFTETGTYYVWVRGRVGFAGGNSVHVGLNGAEVATADRLQIDTRQDWGWNNRCSDW